MNKTSFSIISRRYHRALVGVLLSGLALITLSACSISPHGDSSLCKDGEKAFSTTEARNGIPASPGSDLNLLVGTGIPSRAGLGEFRTNVFRSGTQENISIARLSSGDIIAVWESRRQQQGGYGVYGRLFSTTGHPVSDEFHVNVPTRGMQRFPVVAADTRNGGFWVVWSSFGQDGDGWGIVARRFSSDVKQISSEIIVNATRTGQQAFASAAVSAAGDLLVGWIDSDPESTPRLVTRLISRSGEFKGPERYNDAAGKDLADRTPVVAWQPDSKEHQAGQFVVVWAQSDRSGVHSNILLQKFDAAGVPRNEPIIVANSENHRNIEPAIAFNPKGDSVIGWLSSTDRGYDLSARLYDHTFRSIAPVWTRQAAADEFFSGIAVALSADRRTLVAYNRADQDFGEDVLGLVLDDSAVSITSDPITLTRQTVGIQKLSIARGGSCLIWDPDERLSCVAWSGEGQLGDSTGTHMTIWDSGGDNGREPGALARTSPESPMIPQETTLDQIAQPHLPPVFDSNWKPLPRLKNNRGDGPDFGFEAVSGTGWTPPDPEMAVGPNHIVVIVNGQIAFFNKNGDQLFAQQIEGSSGFWGSVGATNFVFDPEVLYDRHAHRFWAMVVERSSDNKSKFLLAVSDDDNPVGTWYKWRLDVTLLAGNDIDSPNMALNSEAVFLTADFFTPMDKYLIYILDKIPLLSGGSPVVKSLLITGQQSIGLPTTEDAGMTTQYMIESTESSLNTTIRFHALQNVLTAPTRTTYDLTVEPYRYPGQPPQMGTSYRPYLFEPRFWSCMYINGSLWATHHIRRVGEDETIVRWYQFAMNGWPVSGVPTLVQWGDIALGSGIYSFFPSICADTSGNAAVTFARSGESEYISMWRALRRSSDPAGTFPKLALVKNSLGPSYTDRWGDYSGTKMDPVQPNIFWGHHEWEDASSNWRTWVAKYDNNPAPVPSLTFAGVLGILFLLSAIIFRITFRRNDHNS